MFTFSTVAIASYDRYQGIRTVEKLKNKFIDWIPKSIKYQAQNGSSADSDSSEPIQTLDDYIAQYFWAVEIKHMTAKIERWNKEYDEECFRLTNIAKAYKNPTFTPLFLFEACYMPLSNRLNGSKPKRKLEALQRWYKKLSDYNKERGDMRKLLNEYNKLAQW